VKFLTKLLHSGNIVCTLFTDIINRELASLDPNVMGHCCDVKPWIVVYSYV